MEYGSCQCTCCQSKDCGLHPTWRATRGRYADSTVCTWYLSKGCNRICKDCQCGHCGYRGEHCQCGERNEPMVMPPQPSLDAVVEPRIVVSWQSSEADFWTAAQDTSGVLRPIPATSQPPMPPPKSEAAPQSPSAEERVELLEYQAFAAEKRNQELRAQCHHLRGLYFGLDARVRQLEYALDNPWIDLN